MRRWRSIATNFAISDLVLTEVTGCTLPFGAYTRLTQNDQEITPAELASLKHPQELPWSFCASRV